MVSNTAPTNFERSERSVHCSHNWPHSIITAKNYKDFRRMMNIKRLFFFILCLLLPNWLGAKEWTTSDFNGEDYKFVFNILKLGEIVSDWTHVGNQYLLVEYDDEFYVCEIDARVINTTHMIIKCRDRRLK